MRRDGDEVPDTLPADVDLAARAREILDAAWRPQGFTSPNLVVYPWQWLWDSCFHAVVWAHLGDERATVELTSALSAQDEDGFVPHIRYRGGSPHDGFWGRPETSSITQPPMYGHALAELVRQGFDPPDELVERCRAGLWHLLRDRSRHSSGLVRICHPWESGCDDSPRWDHWCPGGFEPARWYEAKGELLASIVRGPAGAPASNPAFDVAPAGFNALVVFNAGELAEVTGDRELASRAGELRDRLDECWDDTLVTWVDAGPSAADSGQVRTVDGLLPVMCTASAEQAAAALRSLDDADAHGGPYGPTGVHRGEPSFAARTYWRGPVWPQLAYLLWVGATRRGDAAAAGRLAETTRRGAVRSGFAEYWDPDTGEGLGAIPQSWTTLTAIMTPPTAPP